MEPSIWVGVLGALAAECAWWTFKGYRQSRERGTMMEVRQGCFIAFALLALMGRESLETSGKFDAFWFSVAFFSVMAFFFAAQFGWRRLDAYMTRRADEATARDMAELKAWQEKGGRLPPQTL